jgi:hypothetical protein
MTLFFRCHFSDFGQTKFDNAILNLEPFEQRLDENRPFFTEGTNLFNIETYFILEELGSTKHLPRCGKMNEVTNYPSSVNLSMP